MVSCMYILNEHMPPEEQVRSKNRLFQCSHCELSIYIKATLSVPVYGICIYQPLVPIMIPLIDDCC
jgi:hypothetical protein